MTDNAQSVADLLRPTPLAGRQVVEIPVLETGETAFALPVTAAALEAEWQVVRDLLSVTGRWPVVVANWAATGTFEEWMGEADLFSRYGFEYSGEGDAALPAAIVARSRELSIDRVMADLSAAAAEEFDLEDALDAARSSTKRLAGTAPSEEEVAAAGLGSAREVEAWFLAWERARELAPEPESMCCKWYVPDDPAVLLLPTARGCDSLAYLSWFGAETRDAAMDVAVLRAWEDAYGAELIAHFGTMLQFRVARPPEQIDTALALAHQQDLLAPCTLLLPGESVRHHARGLTVDTRWFLHERP